MRNKTTAILLAIFLGGLGIHRFYLRQPGRGVLYLLFCWTFIPSLIGIIDGIMLAVMTDDKFYAKYNKEAYSQLKETANEIGADPMQLKHAIDASVRANRAQINNYAYNPKNIVSKGIQVLESLYLIGYSTKVDTVKGRFSFLQELYDEILIASQLPRYFSDVQNSIDEYKLRYYDRIPSENEISLLLKPNLEHLLQYYSTNMYRCFIAQYNEQLTQIDALKRKDAKDKRYEKLIDIADDASYELSINGDNSDQTGAYITDIDSIRENLYKTRYES